MPRQFKPKILTSNHLLEGDVIYWNQGKWERNFEDSQVFHAQEEAEAALINAQGQPEVVVGAYLVEVEVENGVLKPAHFREDFRATGPSNYFHGKQEAQDV